VHAHQQHRLACYTVMRLNIWSKVSTNTSKTWSLGANCFICRLPVGCHGLGVCEELHASLAIPVQTNVLMHDVQTNRSDASRFPCLDANVMQKL